MRLVINLNLVCFSFKSIPFIRINVLFILNAKRIPTIFAVGILSVPPTLLGHTSFLILQKTNLMVIPRSGFWVHHSCGLLAQFLTLVTTASVSLPTKLRMEAENNQADPQNFLRFIYITSFCFLYYIRFLG